jgi:cell cycle sensor histidine kinase DivJ
VSPLAHVSHYIDSLVHPSARQDLLTAARHRAFIAPRLLGSLAALATTPVYLAVRGVPSALEFLVFAWLVAPILIAYFLSRTGRYEIAYALSSLALTALVTAVAASTGGITSFAAVWLIVVPLEAASVSRRVVALAAGFALAATGLLLLLNAVGFIQAAAPNDPAVLAAFGIVSAALYATGLALAAESLARTSTLLHADDEERYRLLAHNVTDVIARYGRHGAIRFSGSGGTVRCSGSHPGRPRAFRSRPCGRSSRLFEGVVGFCHPGPSTIRRVPGPVQYDAGACHARRSVHLDRDALPPARTHRAAPRRPA